jgi:biotin transporter BioY
MSSNRGADDPTRAGVPSPQEARAQLQAAGATRVVRDADRRLLVGFTAALGVLVGSILALSWWTLSQRNTAGFAASFAGYAAVLTLLLGLQRRANAAPRGFGTVYRRGLALTMALYAIGVAWFSARSEDPAPGAVFLPYCALVAVPCLVAAVLIDRRARR